MKHRGEIILEDTISEHAWRVKSRGLGNALLTRLYQLVSVSSTGLSAFFKLFFIIMNKEIFKLVYSLINKDLDIAILGATSEGEKKIATNLAQKIREDFKLVSDFLPKSNEVQS